MKRGLILLGLSIVLLISCKKESNTGTNLECGETYNSAFSDYVHTVQLRMKGYYNGGGMTSNIYKRHEFKFDQGQSYDGKYFYTLKKQHRFWNKCELLDSTSWSNAGFYRYDAVNQKSYYYQTVNDQNPMLLFDFSNRSPGDTILIDQSMDVQIVVHNVHTEVLNGVSYPSISGKIISYYHVGYPQTGNQVGTGGLLRMSPFAPNPVLFDVPHLNYADNPFSGLNFCPSYPPDAGMFHQVNLTSVSSTSGDYSSQGLTISP